MFLSLLTRFFIQLLSIVMYCIVSHLLGGQEMITLEKENIFISTKVNKYVLVNLNHKF